MIGDDDRVPTAAELEQMKQLVAQAMKDGALGISTALIYPPGHYAKTEELIELAKVVAPYGGVYGSHMRSEGASEMAAVDEAIRIGREAGIPVEIFHLKVSGKPRWGSMKQVVAKIQEARAQGSIFAPTNILILQVRPPWQLHCHPGLRTAELKSCWTGFAMRKQGNASRVRWRLITRNGRTSTSIVAADRES